MNQIRKKLSAEDLSAIIEKLTNYKDIHGKIADLETQLKEMQERKEMLVTELELARADEEMLIADMTMKYGPGRLDPKTLEWVEEETKNKAENNEYIERM